MPSAGLSPGLQTRDCVRKISRRDGQRRPGSVSADVSHCASTSCKQWYGPRRAVTDVSFAIERGEVVGLLGPAIWPHVFENVAYPLRVRRRPAAEIKDLVLRALRLVEMEQFAQRLAPALSGRQQQRSPSRGRSCLNRKCCYWMSR